MLNHARSLTPLLLFLCLAFSAHSSVFKSEPDGLFSDIRHHSHERSAKSSSPLELELALVVDSFLDEAYYSDNQVPRSAAHADSDNSADDINLIQDVVRVNSAIGGRHDAPFFGEDLNVSDSRFMDGALDSFSESAGIETIDWLFDGDIKPLNLTGGDRRDHSHAFITSHVYALNPNGTLSGGIETYYALDLAKFSIVNIAEPSPLFLIVIGGVALMIRRRSDALKNGVTP